MKEVYGIIYKTTNLVNGKIYIGQTIRLNKKSYIGSGTLISAAIKKYGRENFVREVLEKCFNQIDLDIYEELYIEQYDSRNKKIGYNIAKGSVLGSIGENNHMYGKKHSAETKEKLREANTGKTPSEETRSKLREAMKGRKITAETRSKMSEAHKGKNNPMYGKTLSAEHRAKVSEAQKGKTLSSETRSKLREAKKGNSIQVLQYDKHGNFISEYPSIKEASRQTGINRCDIRSCCKGRLKSAGGYIWKYK